MQPSNAAVKAIFKQTVLEAYLDRGFKIEKPPMSEGLNFCKRTVDSIIIGDFHLTSHGGVWFFAPGVHYIEVEKHLVQAVSKNPPKNVSYGEWWRSTLHLYGPFKEAPGAPYGGYNSLEEAQVFFRDYTDFMHNYGFQIIETFSTLQGVNEELEKSYIKEGAPALWTALNMGGTLKYCRAMIISKLCNGKYFDERLGKLYEELHRLINDPDPQRGSRFQDTLSEFESALSYIRQIKPIYNI